MKAWAAGAFRSLRVYNYRLWAGGSLVSNVGSWVQRIAQDWLVLVELTDHSASAVGLVTALQFGPQLLLLPWTGLAADRLDQRRLMMVTQACMALLAVALGVLTVLGIVELWHVYVFGFLFGCAAAFDAPARQAFVGELVGERDLANAVALNSTTFNGARMIGPAVAGFAIGTVGTGWAFLLNGASFLAVLGSLLFLRRGELFPQARATAIRGGMMEGFRYVWRRPDLRVILVMLFLIGTFGMNFAIWTSTMAVRVFETDANGYGLLSTMMALGTVSGALIAAGRDQPVFSHLLLGTGGFGIACFLAAVAPGYWTFGIALALAGVATITFLNSSNALMQLTTESSMRGRVMALRMAITLGGTPIGAPIVGWLTDVYGPRWSLGVGVAAGLSAAVVGVLYARRNRVPPVPVDLSASVEKAEPN
jgi:MFS family permease